MVREYIIRVSVGVYHRKSVIINYMNKWALSTLAIIIALAIFFFATRSFEVQEPQPARDLSLSIPSLTPPSLDILPNNNSNLAQEAWEIFQNYLAFAHAHDLEGLRTLSHQISDTCNNPAKEKGCFELMDSVYTLASPFTLNDFKNIISDEKQIIMYTDGPDVVMLYFTRKEDGTPKVLGMRFCLENATETISCVETDPTKRDLNNNGWWDSVESLFY